MSNRKSLLIAEAYILEPDKFLRKRYRANKDNRGDVDCRYAWDFSCRLQDTIEYDVNDDIEYYASVFKVSINKLLKHSKYIRYTFESTETVLNVYQHTFIDKKPKLMYSFDIGQFPYHYAAIGIFVKDHKRYYPKISDYQYIFGTCEADALEQLSKIPYRPGLDKRTIIKFPLNHLGGPKYAWCEDEKAWDYDRFPATLRSDYPERIKQLDAMPHIDRYYECMRYIKYEVDQVDDNCQISKRTWMYGWSMDVEEYIFGDCIPLIK